MEYDARKSRILNWLVRKLIAKMIPKSYNLTCNKCHLRAFNLVSWNMTKNRDLVLYYKCICCGKRKKVTLNRGFKEQLNDMKKRRQ